MSPLRTSRRGRGASVPDARMFARFDYWFETKTVPNALNAKQLSEHYKNLTEGAQHIAERPSALVRSRRITPKG